MGYIESMSSPRFSLWVMPTGKLQDELQEIVHRLALNHGGPIFEPHVTILGGIPALTLEEAKIRTAQLARELRPYELSFERLATSHEYHRCLFIRMKQTEVIVDAFRRAQKIFGHTDNEHHMSHLSLFYGTPSPEEKEHMAQEIRIDLNRSFIADTLYLYSSETKGRWDREAVFAFAGGSVDKL